MLNGGIMVVKLVNIGKVLMISYIITGVLLVMLSFGLYKFAFSDVVVTIAIMAVYVISTLVGGYIMARLQQNRRLIWGVIFGLIYFFVLAMTSLIMNKGVNADIASALKALIMCILGGAAGGFITPVKE